MTEAVKIVLVNDDPVALRLMERTLEDDGFETHAYTSATDAVSALSGGLRPELIVADLHMPGIDGWKLCRLLRGPEMTAFNEVPILVVSATFTGVDVESITRDLGANAFLPAPYHPETLRTYVRELLTGAHPQKKLEVLVVEDDEDLSRILARTFDRNGYQVTVARDGVAALEAGARQRFDIYVVDFHLPDTKARTLIHRLRQPDQAGVVLVITGDDDPTLPIELLESGADGYLRKPFDPQYLLDVAQKARRERSLLRVEALLERRTTELRESDARIRALFRAIPDWVLVVNWQGRVIQANEAAFRDLPDEVPLVGSPLTDILCAEELAGMQDRLAAAWSSGRGSFEATLEAGTRRWTMEMAAEVTELDGDPVLLIVARDITGRRDAERRQRELDARMQHTQRMQSLGVLAGGIAHEFNNLLVGILGNASLGLAEAREASVLTSLEQIEQSARRAAELTNQMLTFSGHSQAAVQVLDPGEIVDGVADLVRPAAPGHVRIETGVAPDALPVEGDPAQLRQAVMNIFLNALDAVKRSGAEAAPSPREDRILASVTTRRLDEGADLRGFVGSELDPGPYVEIAVSDTGPGLTPEELERVFEPFFTTKFTGRGLGLSVALGILQSHGGAIRAESRPGEGAVFRMVIPAAQPAGGARGAAGGPEDAESSAPTGAGGGEAGTGQAGETGAGESSDRERAGTDEGSPGARSDADAGSAASGPAPVGSPLAGMKVLVVDDEPAVLRMVSTIFRREGAVVYPAGDGEEALEVFDEAPSSWELVVADYSMPGLDGQGLLRALRERGSPVPVLLSSGYQTDQMGALSGDGLEPLGFLAKPYRPADLVEQASELVHRATGEAAPQGVS